MIKTVYNDFVECQIKIIYSNTNPINSYDNNSHYSDDTIIFMHENGQKYCLEYLENEKLTEIFGCRFSQFVSKLLIS